LNFFILTFQTNKSFMNLKTWAVALVSIGWMACITEDSSVKSGPVAPGTTASTENQDPASITSIKWLDSTRNLGNVLEGQQVEVWFRFINTGSKPLVIADAKPSCGCTVPEKPEEPIMPGQEGQIKAVFNSQGRTGSNHKTITVSSNTTPASHVLEFNVNVLGKKDGPKPATASDAAAPKQF
jgi:hypothetical protein